MSAVHSILKLVMAQGLTNLGVSPIFSLGDHRRGVTSFGFGTFGLDRLLLDFFGIGERGRY